MGIGPQAMVARIALAFAGRFVGLVIQRLDVVMQDVINHPLADQSHQLSFVKNAPPHLSAQRVEATEQAVVPVNRLCCTKPVR